MVKKEIRKKFLDKRNQLSQEVVEEMNRQIMANFSAIKIKDPRVLFSYFPIPEHSEFDTALCDRYLKERDPQMKIAWPRIHSATSSMEAIVLDTDTLFTKNQYNILEPVSGEIMRPENIDVVFVPLLAFDKRGFRVGYGKGYYDRYLSRCRPDIVKIGFSFFEAVAVIDDINEFDVPLNYCITPMRGYEF
jgi:5-formyltetrahydrofolate cyclo-ligase